MEQLSIKSRPTLLYVLIGVLCLAVFGGIVFWQYQKPDRKSDAGDQNKSTVDNQAIDAVSIAPQDLSPTDNLYSQGTIQLAQKNYSEAIKFFDQAIAADPYQPQYYSDKSAAEYNLGDKQSAINTLKQGSSLNPDSDLLKSKLDVLTKDQFSDPNIDTTRE